MTNAYEPAEIFCPGEHLADSIAALGLAHDDVASRLGLTMAELHALLVAEKRVDSDLAASMASVVGGSKELWLRLQASWDENPQLRSRPPAASA